MSVDLTNVSSVELLTELARRHGNIRALGQAGLLCARKAEDYNAGEVDRSDYFPFGLISYSQMIHTKSQRLISLCRKNSESAFEPARDTCLDLINYASFAAEFLENSNA